MATSSSWIGGKTKTNSTITFFSPTDDPEALRPETGADPIACIWDLSVVAHERVAWIRNILAADARGLDAYLADTLSGMV